MNSNESTTGKQESNRNTRLDQWVAWQRGHMAPLYTLSPPLLALRRHTVPFLGKRETPALILGETGVGKELIAELIHKEGERRDKPFIPVNCAALAPGLIESELFGHKKGAFTGATQDRVGFIEQADGGTLFLDEFGELEAHVQAKLLRLLPGGEYCRAGDSKPRSSSARILAATNNPDRLREDIRWRFSDVEEIGPLRERKADIFVILAACLAEANLAEQLAKNSPWKKRLERRPLEYIEWRISGHTLVNLLCSPFLGNVRELLIAAECSIAYFVHEYAEIPLPPEHGGLVLPLRYSPPLAQCPQLNDWRTRDLLWKDMRDWLLQLPGMGERLESLMQMEEEEFELAGRSFRGKNAAALEIWHMDYAFLLQDLFSALYELPASLPYLSPMLSGNDEEAQWLWELALRSALEPHLPSLPDRVKACWNEGAPGKAAVKVKPLMPTRAEAEEAYFRQLRAQCGSLKEAALVSGMALATCGNQLQKRGLGYRASRRKKADSPE